MKYLISLICAFFFFEGNAAIAQEVLSGELNRITFAGRQVSVLVMITTESDYLFDKVIDWGDGSQDTLQNTSIYKDSNNKYVSKLSGVHDYPDTGFYTIKLKNIGTWSTAIKNIENPGEKEFQLSERIYAKEFDEFKNDPPVCFYDFDWLGSDENGIIYHEVIGSYVGPSPDSITYEFIPATEEGYSFPEATDEIRCCIFWDKPVEAGLYTFAVKINGWRFGEIVGSMKRYMTIQIDSDLIVSNNDLFPQLNALSLFPNPTTSTLHLQLQHPQATQGKLSIENLAGQALYAEALNLSPALQSWQVDVADWPAGVYVVRLQAGAEQVVQKFVKE